MLSLAWTSARASMRAFTRAAPLAESCRAVDASFSPPKRSNSWMTTNNEFGRLWPQTEPVGALGSALASSSSCTMGKVVRSFGQRKAECRIESPLPSPALTSPLRSMRNRITARFLDATAMCRRVSPVSSSAVFTPKPSSSMASRASMRVLSMRLATGLSRHCQDFPQTQTMWSQPSLFTVGTPHDGQNSTLRLISSRCRCSQVCP
mmetsp:Transcript_2239/g.5229  ORF Transcript_2239/g.5229 Transcript_2239/m.5229 type:complete len:206 (+) Transcript_2239:322-939(+)